MKGSTKGIRGQDQNLLHDIAAVFNILDTEKNQNIGGQEVVAHVIRSIRIKINICIVEKSIKATRGAKIIEIMNISGDMVYVTNELFLYP